MIAANIEAAIANTQTAVQHWAQDVTENLYTRLSNWESTFPQFDDAIEAERTVRNWKVPTHNVLARIPNALQDQSEYASDTFLVVYGAVCAARYAQVDGRITAAQRDQVLADWNTYWGY